MICGKYYALVLDQRNIQSLGLLADYWGTNLNDALSQVLEQALESEGLSIEEDFERVDINLLLGDADLICERDNEHRAVPPLVFDDTFESDIRALYL